MRQRPCRSVDHHGQVAGRTARADLPDQRQPGQGRQEPDGVPLGRAGGSRTHAGGQQPGPPARTDEHPSARQVAAIDCPASFSRTSSRSRTRQAKPRRSRTSGRCRAAPCGSGRTPGRRGRAAARRWCPAGWTGSSAERYGRAAGSRGCRRPPRRTARRTTRCRCSRGSCPFLRSGLNALRCTWKK